jgi:hypothetical protein
MIDYAYRL